MAFNCPRYCVCGWHSARTTVNNRMADQRLTLSRLWRKHRAIAPKVLGRSCMQLFPLSRRHPPIAVSTDCLNRSIRRREIPNPERADCRVRTRWDLRRGKECPGGGPWLFSNSGLGSSSPCCTCRVHCSLRSRAGPSALWRWRTLADQCVHRVCLICEGSQSRGRSRRRHRPGRDIGSALAEFLNVVSFNLPRLGRGWLQCAGAGGRPIII